MIDLYRVSKRVTAYARGLTKVELVEPCNWRIGRWPDCPWLVIEGDDASGIDVTKIMIGNMLEFTGGPIPLRTMMAMDCPVFDACRAGQNMQWILNNPGAQHRDFTMLLTAYVVGP